MNPNRVGSNPPFNPDPVISISYTIGVLIFYREIRKVLKLLELDIPAYPATFRTLFGKPIPD